MRRIVPSLVLLLSIAIAPMCPAPILDADHLTIDFANDKDARSKAEWSIPNGGKINEDGLGCDKKVCLDSWIQTKPLALGLSWRPTSGARITVKIASPTANPFRSGEDVSKPPDGEFFARYSPDCKHWSTWQTLARDEKETTAAVFKGDLGVPNRERQTYDHYLEKFYKTIKNYDADEEAAVRWILEREPNFFEHELPFVGYVEFLFEGPMSGPWRIKQFEAEVLWGISGLGGANPDLNTRWRSKTR